ncbi:MAG: hypothetical protein AB7L66_08640, partial [Gemmatimonadales bacterium]
AQADSARLIDSPISPDSTERLLNGSRYSANCLARINEDRAGFTLYPPALLSRDPNLVVVRDLQARSSRAVREHPGMPVFLLTRVAGDTVPRFLPLSRDSILALPAPADSVPVPAPGN